MKRRTIKIFLLILLAGGVGFFAWCLLTFHVGYIDKEETGSFLGGSYRFHQGYDGFRVLTSEDLRFKNNPLLSIDVIIDGRYYPLSIITPKARGSKKVKYHVYRDHFVIEKEIYERIKATIPVSREVDEFLAAHVVSRSEALGLIEKKEAACFDALREKGVRNGGRIGVEDKIRQTNDGFTSVSVDYECSSLIRMTVISEGKEEDLIILPKSKGIEKIKYYFPKKDKRFVIKKEVYERIKAWEGDRISKEVDEFLAAHVVETRPDVQQRLP